MGVGAAAENIKAGRYSISEVDKERWDPQLFYDPNPAAPDKTYSKIGGWVREFPWDPVGWRLPIPPRVAQAMDDAQKWAIACTREALEDYGYPKRPMDVERTAVILGNAMAGEKQFFTVMRAYFPEWERELSSVSSFATSSMIAVYLPASISATRPLRWSAAGATPLPKSRRQSFATW